MAKKKQTIENGTSVKFLGYEEGDEGDLKKGAICTVVGYDPEDDTYDVEDAHGNGDSLYADEFEVQEAAPTTGKGKAAAKAAPAAKQEEVAAPTKGKGKGKAAAKQEPAPTTKATKATKAAPAAKGKAKGKQQEEQEEVPLPAFKKTASVAKALKDFANPLDAAADLAEQKEKIVFTLGGVLAYVKRNNLHATIESDTNDEDGNPIPLYTADLAGFDKYAESTLGIGKRSANYYVQLYEKFSQITTEAKLAKIGWTKLRELLRLNNLLDENSVDTWLEVARTGSTTEVKDAVKEAIVDAGDGHQSHGNTRTATMTTWKLATHDDQTELVKECFAMAREVLGEDATDSQCFVHICGEWNQMGYEEEGEEEAA